MSDTANVKEEPGLSFFDLAAWFSAGIASVVAVVATGILAGQGNTLGDLVIGGAFWSVVVSFILGFVSLCGYRRYRLPLSKWAAAMGMTVSALSGLPVLYAAFLNAMGHNC